MMHPSSFADLHDPLLVTLINTLQDIFASVAVCNPIDLPQISIIGSQGIGKNLMLASILGKDLLPRESNYVTRRPLILQCIHRLPTTKCGPISVSENKLSHGEWAEFLHLPGQKFQDMIRIRQIIKETNGNTGRNEGISLIPISLIIYSPNLPPLTLVNLPDLAKVPIGQPTIMEEQVRNMLLKQIAKPNTIILVPTDANTNLKDCEGLKLAQEVDPDGQRTICVLQKADTMDYSTDLINTLACQTSYLGPEYITSVSQRLWDIQSTKDVGFPLESRGNFATQKAYQNQRFGCGTAYLARKLHQILLLQINQTLPNVKKSISLSLRKRSAELKSLGGNLVFSSGAEIVLNSITEFCIEYRNILDCKNHESSTNENPRPVRLGFILHDLYSNNIQEVDPSDYIKDAEIRSLMYCCSGSCLEAFADTPAFKCLARSLAKKLEDPSIDCIALVHKELLRIMEKLIQKPIFQRYPELQEKFRDVMAGLLMKAKDSTTKLVRDLVAMEVCSINTGHPDLLSSHQALAIISERYRAADPVQAETMTAKLLSLWRIPSWTFSRSKGQLVMEAPVGQPKDSEIPSVKMTKDVEVVKLLVTSYFNITRRTMTDMVPKAIMLNLVEHTKTEMPKELLENLYHSQLFENLRKDSEHSIKRHRECQRTVECLTKASEIISQF